MKTPNYKKWTIENIQFFKENFMFYSDKEFATKFDKTVFNIQCVLNKHDLIRPNSIRDKVKNRKTNTILNGDFETFYWVGFILADGWIYCKNKNYRLGVSSSYIDHQHLNSFANKLSINIKTRERDTNFLKNSKCSEIEFNDNTNIPLLMKKFDIKPNKSHNPPDFSLYDFTDNQILSLIIGFIDGDGSIVKRGNINSSQAIISIQLHNSWNENLKYINTFLQRHFEIKTKSNVSVNCRGHCVLSLTKYKMLSEIKSFAIKNNLPIMTRKWDNVI